MRAVADKTKAAAGRGAGNRLIMTDIARAAGVSPMTVSRALKPGSPVAEETRQHVLKVISQLGYVPNDIAGGLSSKRSGFAGVLVPSLNNAHFADTVAALTEAIAGTGLQVLIGHTNYRAEQEEQVVETLLRRRPEVMVLTYDGHTARTRELLQRAAIPAIDLWEHPRENVGHVVGFSNRSAARAIAGHMIAKGYTKIAFLGESQDKGTRGEERRKGVQDALRAANLDASRMLAFAPPPITMTHGGQALGEILERWPDTEAVICVSDPCAFGVAAECRRRRIDVPKRLAVAGFGDFEIGRCSVPSITTVAMDATAIGRRAGELICRIREAAARGTTLAPQTIDIPVAVIARQST